MHTELHDVEETLGEQLLDVDEKVNAQFDDVHQTIKVEKSSHGAQLQAMEKKFNATKLVLEQEKLALDQQLCDVEEKMDVQFHIVGQTISTLKSA